MPDPTPEATPDRRTDSTPGAPGKKAAGAFDIRNFIGALLGLYGLILTFTGLFGDQELAKTGGVNANLYAGLGLVVVSVGFLAWARVKPIIVPAQVEPPDDDPTRPGPTRKDAPGR